MKWWRIPWSTLPFLLRRTPLSPLPGASRPDARSGDAPAPQCRQPRSGANSAGARSTNGSTPIPAPGAGLGAGLPPRSGRLAGRHRRPSRDMSAATPPIRDCSLPRFGSSLYLEGDRRAASRRAGTPQQVTTLAYQWLCGGVSVNYHMLADFRSQGRRRNGTRCSPIDRCDADGRSVSSPWTGSPRTACGVRADAGKSSFRALRVVWRNCWKWPRNRSRRSSNWPKPIPRNSWSNRQPRRPRAASLRRRQARIEEESGASVRGIADHGRRSAREKGRKREKSSEARKASTTDPEAQAT